MTLEEKIITLLAYFSLFLSHPPLNVLEQATIKQCVVGPNHAAFLLEVNCLFTLKVGK